MGKLKQFIDNLSSTNRFSWYLSIFRVFLGFHIIKKIYLLWGSQSILLSNGVLFEHKEMFLDYFGFNSEVVLANSSILLLSIVALSIFMILGIGRNITVFILYFFIKILQDLTYPILNGGDNLMIFVLLYFCFASSFEHLTLYKQKVKTNKSYLISNLAVYSICFHLGYVYFISAIHKIHADVWFNGTALYYVMNLERFSSPISSLFSDNGVITTLGTYFTLLFELLFIFLVWDKKYKVIFLISGIMLHAGIYFFMMIYDFEIFFVSLYGFFLSNQLYERLAYKANTFLLNFKTQRHAQQA
ncbi:hypothetical protein [Tenacibaculum xiamenense]|uniref:hypothetical protein n=1 Tax=Tenacibaculum xiamenense TaxID=1261553 RepID=UPI00389664B3